MEEGSEESDCKLYIKNLGIMWGNLAKITGDAQSPPNNKHLHNIAKIIKGYLDQHNVPEIAFPYSAHQTANNQYYEILIKPLLFEILIQLKRNASPDELVDTVLQRLRAFILNPANRACRDQNIRLISNSFTSVYVAYLADVKSCHYYVDEHETESFGSQNSIDSEPLNPGKLFGRKGQGSGELSNKSDNSNEKPNRREGDIKIRHVYDMLNSYRSNGTNEDNTASEYNESDMEIQALTRKISSLLTNLQTDRSKRSMVYQQNAHRDSFLQYCRSFLLKRFLDSITVILQEYIDNAICKNYNNVLSVSESESIGYHSFEHTDPISDVTKTINKLLALAKFPINDDNHNEIDAGTTIPTPFKTNGDYLSHQIKTMEKLMHPNGYGGFIKHDTKPGTFDDEALLYVNAGNKEKSYPNNLELVNTIYKTGGNKQFGYPKKSLNEDFVKGVPKNYRPFFSQNNSEIEIPGQFFLNRYSNAGINPMKKKQNFKNILSNFEKLSNSSSLNHNNIIKSKDAYTNQIPSQNLNGESKSSNSFNYQFQKESKSTTENEEKFTHSELHKLFSRFLNLPQVDAGRSQNVTDVSGHSSKGSARTQSADTKQFADEFPHLRNSQLLDIISKLSTVQTIDLTPATETGPEKNIELTYVVRQPQVFLYQPQVLVKQRLKYEHFLKNLNSILNKTLSSNKRVKLQKIVKWYGDKDTVLFESAHTNNPLKVMDAETLEEKLSCEQKCKEKKNSGNIASADQIRSTLQLRIDEPLYGDRAIELHNSNGKFMEGLNSDTHFDAKEPVNYPNGPFDATELAQNANSNAKATEYKNNRNSSSVSENRTHGGIEAAQNIKEKHKVKQWFSENHQTSGEPTRDTITKDLDFHDHSKSAKGSYLVDGQMKWGPYPIPNPANYETPYSNV